MRIIIEAGCYLALGYAFFSIGAVRAYWKALPKPHKWILGSTLLLLVVGQLIDRPRQTFPVSSWTMYGKHENSDTLVFYRYRGLDGQGNFVPVSEQALSVIDASGVASKTKGLAKAALSPQAREEDRTKLTDWL